MLELCNGLLTEHLLHRTMRTTMRSHRIFLAKVTTQPYDGHNPKWLFSVTCYLFLFLDVWTLKKTCPVLGLTFDIFVFLIKVLASSLVVI